ncbi:hypothetical protein BDZ45DRAFT_804915 [Acephala macrosclerotiorum]|nr:hypothetical protein BDZ45DRAFT_804915 [Acephala macrosclerotiorum]
MDAPNATELGSSSDANALFSESHLFPIQSVDSPASYFDFFQSSEESQAWLDINQNASTSVFPWSYSDSWQAGHENWLLQGDASLNEVSALQSWVIPDSTAQSYATTDFSPTLPRLLNQYGWNPPSVVSDTSYSVFRCDWPQCSKEEFDTAEEYKLHTKTHARDIRSRWQPSNSSNKCTWYKCTSQARLKTSKLFEDHINNIHINPLLCTRDGCKHKTPFRGKADLQRHIDSVHDNTPKINCPYRTCLSSYEKPFSRKDKLISHLRKVHDTDPCPYDHCVNSMFSSLDYCESTAKHIGKMHSEFECALRSCYGTRSQFSEESFMAHLQLHHGIRWELVLKIKDIAKKDEARILRDHHVVGLFEFSDCTSCPKLCRRK